MINKVKTELKFKNNQEDCLIKKIMNCPFKKIYLPTSEKNFIYFMTLAYNKSIEGWVNNEIPVGAVIELNGVIIGASYNQVESTCNPTAHAEILAITEATNNIGEWRLDKACLYTTKEPCPMCAGAAIMSRIKSVYYAFSDSKIGCLGGAASLQKLNHFNHLINVYSGILEKECKTLFKTFFKEKRKYINQNKKLLI